MEYYIGAWKKFAEFSGRARRKEYWMFVLINVIVSAVLGFVDGLLGMMLLANLYSLAVLIPSLAIGARRLHDTGRSGWWQLLWLVPVVGWIVIIVFLVQDSHDENDYGANPKMA
ncbi:DUF805 domain-containing protein [Shewanella submarina]|uniref:DUF805 domain-containing protein n=1 Tax=Shewanella submarina TaxID=2016376 RepID=A0ABV7GEE9_9GAMM|nr:DUF805 domain-containing protein [Shewanella submarina]MCL1036766.1 DUF805 domain-containing protein [Shewanella submarina]